MTETSTEHQAVGASVVSSVGLAPSRCTVEWEFGPFHHLDETINQAAGMELASSRIITITKYLPLSTNTLINNTKPLCSFTMCRVRPDPFWVKIVDIAITVTLPRWKRTWPK